eukprot:2885298-Heterocapsa_arctica.AAC.1
MKFKQQSYKLKHSLNIKGLAYTIHSISRYSRSVEQCSKPPEPDTTEQCSQSDYYYYHDYYYYYDC